MRSDHRKLLIVSILATSLVAGVARAQSDPNITRLDIPISDSGEAYRKAVRFSRIEAELFYVDNLEGEIPLGRPPKLSSPPETPEPREGVNWRMLGIFGAILAALVFLILRFGGGSGALAVRRPGDGQGEPRQNGKKTTGENGYAGTSDGLLAEINAMPDRRAALILLLQHSLRHAASAHELRLGRSETARDILRRVPAQWAHSKALRKLVMAEELVQFGGRMLAEATFEECLNIATPILKGAR